MTKKTKKIIIWIVGIFIVSNLFFGLLSVVFDDIRKKEPIPAEDTPVQTDEDSLTIAKCKALYDELMAFKDETDFVKFGFGVGGPYKEWKDRVEAFTNDEQSKSLLKYGIVAGDLMTIGMEYVSSKGKETETTRQLIRNFEAAFESTSMGETEPIETYRAGNSKLIGKWMVTNKAFPKDQGYTIEIREKDGEYFSIERDEIKPLKKEGEKYIIIGDAHNEFYMIKNGGLRLCDLDGDFTDSAGYEITKQ